MSIVSSRTGRRRLPMVGRAETLGARPKRRRWVIAAIVGGGLLGLLWLAPTIVAHTPLFNSALAALTGDLQGDVRVQSASLGWFSPIVLTEVEARGADGAPLAKIPVASTQRTLFDLMTGGGDPGLRLEQPRITLTLDDEGSNLERFLEKVLANADPNDANPFSLEVSDAELVVVDQAARREWHVDKFALTLDSPGREPRPVKLSASGVVHDQGYKAPFKAAASLQNVAFSGSGQTSQGGLKLQGERLHLELLAHAWRRLTNDPRGQLTGVLSADVNAEWSFSNVGLKSFSAEGRLEIEELLVASTTISDQPLELASLKIPLDLRVKDGGLDVKQLDLACDWGQLQLKGRLADWQNWSQGKLGWENLAPLARSEGQVVADIDLAALARVMPGLIRLREGTEVTSGRLQAKVSSRAANQGWAWDAVVQTSRIEATHQGRHISWDEPIQVDFAAEDVGAGLEIKKLLADSDFLQIQGEGNLDYLSVSATYELDRLAQELSQFIDLGDWRLAGDGYTYATWQRQGRDAFAADADIQVRGLSLAAGGRATWQEENLLCNVDLTGRLDGVRIEQIEKLLVHLDAQTDRGDASLLNPVSWKGTQHAWPFDVKLSGRIERWLARAALLTSQADAWKAKGDAQLACRVDYASDKIDVPKFDLKANNLQMEQFGFLINEPVLEMTGSGSFSGEPLRWEVREMVMSTSSLEARARDIVGRYSSSGTPEITGDLEFAAGLAQWRNAWRPAGEASRWQLDGDLQGKARIAGRGGVLTADVQANVRQFTARYGQGPLVTEPDLRFAARGAFDRRSETLTLDRATVEAEALSADVAGTLRDVTRQRTIDVRGKLSYDLEKLQGLLAPYLGEGVAVSGRSSREFSLSGPLGEAHGLQIEKLNGEGSLAWDALASYGFVGGPGVLAAKLNAGKVAITPLDFAMNDGRCKLTPTLLLTPSPGEFRLPRELVLDQVRVTPQMCAQALAYVAPVLAGVAQADGKFSVALDGGRIPLDDPRQGDVSGTLTVHDVRVSAGPLVQALAIVLSRGTEARLTQEAEVPFRMVQGRVYHKDLELVFPEMTIRTHGSVGFDRSLAILAEMPVPPKWIGTNTLGTALQGQTIRLPIGGTLDQPAIDRRELDRLAAQFIQDAAGKVLQQELGKQLDRLLGPPK